MSSYPDFWDFLEWVIGFFEILIGAFWWLNYGAIVWFGKRSDDGPARWSYTIPAGCGLVLMWYGWRMFAHRS